MLELNYALNLIIKGIESTTNTLGFKVEYPEGVRPPEVPVTVSGEKSIVMFRGEKGRIRFEYDKGRLALFCATADEADTPDDDMQRVSLSLLELDNIDERDLKYIFEDFNETILTKYASKRALQPANKKLPTPVSKSQAKSGALSYDANTLASRFTTLYPELRDDYKANIDEFGEFLPEEFFIKVGNNTVEQVIKGNDKAKIKKLMNLFGEIYEDGTNDTQSLIAVTILGEIISKDMTLLDNIAPYFTETMEEPVTEVIKYLASGKSKSARMRLMNPPLYKPKKKKNKSGIASMLGM